MKLVHVLGKELLTSNLPMDFIIAELNISPLAAKKLNVALSIITRTLKLDTTPEDDNDNDANSADAATAQS